MSLRKAVFQTKVLQRLYPVSVEPEKVVKSPEQPPKAARSSSIQQKLSKVTGGNVGGSGVSDKKVYTVLPPPDDYVPARGDGSAEAANPEAVNNADELPGSDDHSAAEDEFPARKRRKRKRRAKASSLTDCTPILSDTSDKTESTQKMSAARSPEPLSKNKKRKLKKKRHKEKLRALGLVPRSTALEFTYKQSQENESEEEEEEEEEEGQIQKVQEVLEFLQSTWDIYLSECSGSAGDSSLPVAAVESLLIRLSDGSSPSTVISSLCRLRSLLARREVELLLAALDEFRCTSTLQKDETEVLCRLFHYWINEILPMQLEKNT